MSAQTTENGRQHQQSPLKTERGTTTIQDSVVSQVAGMAAQEVEASGWAAPPHRLWGASRAPCRV